MIRISSARSAAPVLSAYYASAATTITIVAIWLFAYFTKSEILRNLEWKMLSGGGLLSLYFIAFFLHFRKSIPQRVSIDDTGITARFNNIDHKIRFEDLTDIKIIEANTVRFLVVKTKRRNLKIEVSEGETVQINKYIPTYKKNQESFQ